jgi:FkbM family methyltransferase
MQAINSLTEWLDHLRRLDVPQGVVHVGAGNGASSLGLKEWGVEHLVLIEADDALHGKLLQLASSQPGWSAHAAVLHDADGEADFYLASNPNENGLIAPDALRALWANIQVRDRRTVSAITLDSLLASEDIGTDQLNWLFVSCLPAVRILRGALKLLESLDVIVARVVLNDSLLPMAGVSRIELDAFLAGHGFGCVGYEEERHPGLGQAVYRRNWKSLVGRQRADFQAARASHERELEDLRHANEELVGALSRQREQHKQLLEMVSSQEDAAARAQGELVRVVAQRDAQTVYLRKWKALVRQRRAEFETVRAGHEAEIQEQKFANEELALALSRQQESYEQLVEIAKAHEVAAARAQEALTATVQEHARTVSLHLSEVETHARSLREGEVVIAGLQEDLRQANLLAESQAQLAVERGLQVNELTRLNEEQAQRLAKLEEETKVADRQWQAAAEVISQRDHQIAELTRTLQQHGERLARLQHEFDDAVRQSRSQAELMSKRDQQIAELSASLDEQTAARALMQREFDQAIQVREGQAQSSRRLIEELRGLAFARADQARAADELRADQVRAADELGAEVEQLRKALGEAQARVEAEQQRAKDEDSLRDELREARRTAALSVRLQALREADLKDLQGRYQVSVEAQQKQHELLGKLSERLNTASVYFHQLAVANSEAPTLTTGKRRPRRESPVKAAPIPLPAAKKGRKP